MLELVQELPVFIPGWLTQVLNRHDSVDAGAKTQDKAGTLSGATHTHAPMHTHACQEHLLHIRCSIDARCPDVRKAGPIALGPNP